MQVPLNFPPRSRTNTQQFESAKWPAHHFPIDSAPTKKQAGKTAKENRSFSSRSSRTTHLIAIGDRGVSIRRRLSVRQQIAGWHWLDVSCLPGLLWACPESGPDHRPSQSDLPSSGLPNINRGVPWRLTGNSLMQREKPVAELSTSRGTVPVEQGATVKLRLGLGIGQHIRTYITTYIQSCTFTLHPSIHDIHTYVHMRCMIYPIPFLLYIPPHSTYIQRAYFVEYNIGSCRQHELQLCVAQAD